MQSYQLLLRQTMVPLGQRLERLEESSKSMLTTVVTKEDWEKEKAEVAEKERAMWAERERILRQEITDGNAKLQVGQ